MEAFTTTEGKISTYNSGLLLTERVHRLQHNLNMCNSNLLIKGKNGIYGYQLAATLLHSLLAEVYPKMSSAEQKEGLELKKEMDEIIKLPVFRMVNRLDGPVRQIHQENWKIIKEKLFTYELKVRCYIDEHGLSSPNKTDLKRIVGEM